MLPQDNRLNQPSKVLLIEDHQFLSELYAKILNGCELMLKNYKILLINTIEP